MKKSFLKYLLVVVTFGASLFAIADDNLIKRTCDAADAGFCFFPPRVEFSQKEGVRIRLQNRLNRSKPVAEDKRAELQKYLDSRLFNTWYTYKDSTGAGFRADLSSKNALVKHVSTAHEAFLAKLMMIRQAKFTIDLTYYIFRNDETGYALLNELKEAIRRGVSVRLMIDSLGSFNPGSLTHPELKALVHFAKTNAGFMKDRFGKVTTQKARVEVLAFRSVNPIQLSWGALRKSFRTMANMFPFLGDDKHLETIYINPNRRSHDKILIIDQNFPQLSVAIIGGRNIANDYYRLPTDDVSTFEDLEVVVKNDLGQINAGQKGAITADVADLYDLLYFHSGNRVISENTVSKMMDFDKHFAKMDKYSKVIDSATREDQRRLGEDFSSLDFGKKYLNEGFNSGKVDLLYTFDNVLRSRVDAPLDPSKVKEGAATYNSNHINKQIEAYMASEDKHIWIVSPYLWLAEDQILKLKRWIGMKPYRKLTIVTNSMVTTDNLLAQTLVDATIGPKFVLDRSYRDFDGQLRSYGPEQIEMYEFGRIDSKELGGAVEYGKMHAKGLFLEEKAAAFVTTYNADPRSQYLNSELGLFISSESHSAEVKAQLESWISRSHRWGSEEYHAIRRHPALPRVKREAAANVDQMYRTMLKLGIIWLI